MLYLVNRGNIVSRWAKRNLPPDHAVIDYLVSIGAPDETDAFISEF
jgi:hypothetical protein